MPNFDYVNHDNYLQAKAVEISKHVFLGGGAGKFEQAGRGQLISLIQVGLYPHSKILDVGCGCLRGGYWLIHFLNKGCYCGIEPNSKMLDYGIKGLLEPGLVDKKAPRFDNNESYDFSCFKERFDFMIARSVWTHAPKKDIEIMLDQFIKNTTPNGVFLTTYIKPGFRDKEDYGGSSWVGKSHLSNKRGTIAHDLLWIDEQCKKRDLLVQELTLYEHGNQTWLYIKKRS